MCSLKSKHIWILVILVMAFITPVRGQDVPGSNIVSRTLLSSDGTRKLVQRVYDNGLGDAVQEIQSYTGSSLPSVVVHHEYDDYRRRTKTWLPVTSSDTLFVSDNTLSAQAQSQYSDTAPFSRTEYDGFLPSQPSALYKAGAQWQGNGKKVSVTYSEYVGAGMYSPEDGYLYVTADNAKFLCTRTVDEDSCWSAQYTDLNGRLMISETSQGKTYYMYNQKGDVTHVIPPLLSEYLIAHYGYDSEDIPDDDAMVQKYAYIYRYDNQRHCIYKKLPGCEPIYYVYDRTGACILTQDGEQRQSGEWTYTIPDRFGRPCISGVCQYSGSYTAEPLHPVHVYAEYDGTSTATGGYTVHGFALGQHTLYTVAYYDSYSFIGHHGVPSSLTASTVSGFTIDTSLGHGLQTGSATAVLSGGTVTGYTYSAMYYDSRYNVSQVRATNHFGGIETTCTSYSYTGKPVNMKILHTVTGLGTTELDYAYTYDGADRMDSCTLSVAHGKPAVSLTFRHEYDALGRLSAVRRPSKINTSLDVSYVYDLHGWLTGITTNSFKEELFYADGLGTPCYNGNISSVKWKDKSMSSKRGYKLTYDNANRLTQAVYGEGDALTYWPGRYNESIAYDAHGNVTGIARNGYTPNSGSLMDNLTLSYDGNRLTGVSEAAADYDVAGSFEYKRAKGSEYIYNSNGSLIADRSRGIAYITYDVNGNPQNIYFTNGNVTRYVYSATGQKLRVVHYTAAPNITRTFGVQPAELTQAQVLYKDSTDYLLGGSLVMKNGRTDKVLFDGGYAQATYVNSTSDSFSFRYYNKDHLGNNREVESMRGSVYQVTNYYPFGAPFVESTSYFKPDYQPYKYNGKELDLMHGLNTYDYGARQYDPILARWDRVDPLCEKYYSVSPYAYCGNNPILFLDFYGYEPILPQAGTAKGFVNTLCTTGTLSGNMRGAYAHNAMLKFGDIMLHFPRILPANTGKINNYKDKYIYTQKGGWIDMCHFMFYAGRAYKKRVDKAESKKITNSKAYIFMDSYTQMLLINQAYQSPVGEALQEGYFQEMTDRFFAPHSAYSYEDLPSDKFGAEFGAEYFNPDSNLSLGEQLLMYLNDVLGATTPDKAPNYETLPTEEPSSSPSKTNHTTNPIYTSY